MSRFRNSVDRIRAVPGLPRDVLVIIALFAIGLAVGGYILSQQRIVFPWQDRVSFQAGFDEVPSISPGNGQELRVAGVTVGEITDAEVGDDGRAVLTMSFDPGKATIYEDATIELRPKSPLNEMYVNVVDIGTPDAGKITGGEMLDRVTGRHPIPVDEVLSHLDENSREAAGVLLAELDTALATAPESLPPGVVAADTTLQGLESLSTSLRDRRDLLAQLVTGLADIGTGLGQDDARLASLVSNATSTLDAIAAQDDSLRSVLDQLPGLTDDLGTATEALVDLTGELNPTLDDFRAAADILPGALDDLDATIAQVDRTLGVAGPFLADARPVIADLRAATVDLRPATHHVRNLTPMLDPVTAGVVDFLPDIRSFTYNTNSALSGEDANGPIMRGLLQISPSTLDPALIASLEEALGIDLSFGD